jgi:hypothetical protein
MKTTSVWMDGHQVNSFPRAKILYQMMLWFPATDRSSPRSRSFFFCWTIIIIYFEAFYPKTKFK